MTLQVTSDVIHDGNISFYVLGNKVGEQPFDGGKASTTFKPITAGSYIVIAKLTNSQNYADTMSNQATFTITASDLGQDDTVIAPYVSSNPPEIADDNLLKPDIKVELDNSVQKPVVPIIATSPSNVDTSSVANNPTSSKTSSEVSSDPKQDDSNQIVVEMLPSTPITPEQSEQIQTEIDEAYQNGESAELVVVDVSASSNMQKYNEKAKDKVVGIYNTKLLFAGVEIAPDKPLSVELPLPDGANAKAYDVYRLMDDGSLKKVSVKSSSASAVRFETLEMGNYIICERSSNIVFNMIMAVLLAVSLCMSAFILIILLEKKKEDAIAV